MKKFIVILRLVLFFGVAAVGLTAQTKNAPSSETPNFKDVVENKLKKTYGISLDKICPIETDSVASRVFKEYGAIFVSDNGGKIPARCVFDDENQVSAFQSGANPKTVVIGGTSITLQESATNSLLEAIEEAKQQKLRITTRGGSIAASRSYQDTAGL